MPDSQGTHGENSPAWMGEVTSLLLETFNQIEVTNIGPKLSSAVSVALPSVTVTNAFTSHSNCESLKTTFMLIMPSEVQLLLDLPLDLISLSTYVTIAILITCCLWNPIIYC